MRIKIAVPEAFVSPPVVDAALEAVTRLNEHLIRSGQSPTSHKLIKQGAVWRPEPPGDEHFDHGGTIAQRGWGDCDDWAPLHCATLRASGEDPGAVARVIPSGPSTYHAIVQRSDGSVEDPSIAAGMKPLSHRVVGGAAIEVHALDPHDGRVYTGQLLPAVAPLSGHCGPGFHVRGCTVVGHGNFYEARCDVPMNGSPLMAVVGRRHHHRRVGRVPYGFSVTSFGPSPIGALSDALCGAVVLGDAAEMNTSLDRYKLLAVQAAMSGASPGQVRDALVRQMTADVQAAAKASGTHPQQHTQALLAQLEAETGHLHHLVSGYVVGDFFGDIGHIASGIVHTVSNVANDVAKAVSSVPWGDIIHGVQAAVSVVPGLGTAVSNVIAAAETAYDSISAALSGHPLLGAIDAAVNFALASIPGGGALRIIIDPAKKFFEDVVIKGEPIESAALDSAIAAVPDSPKLGPISPRSLVSTLGHLVISHLGLKNTGQGKAAPTSAPHNAPMPIPVPLAAVVPGAPVHTGPSAIQLSLQARGAARHAAAPPPRRPPPPRPVLHMAMSPPGPKKPGIPHAVVHVDHAHSVAQAQRVKPGSPGAPPGATHWHCQPLPGGQWQCQWR
jgi:hypothetical protein